MLLDIYTLLYMYHMVTSSTTDTVFTCCRVEGIILVYYYSLREEGMKVTLVGRSSVAQFPPLGPSPISGALFADCSSFSTALRGLQL